MPALEGGNHRSSRAINWDRRRRSPGDASSLHGALRNRPDEKFALARAPRIRAQPKDMEDREREHCDARADSEAARDVKVIVHLERMNHQTPDHRTHNA